MLGGLTDLARAVREQVRAIDPFIQKHTSAVCPSCKAVCCVNKHAYYNCDDLIYLHALGIRPHGYEDRSDSAPCQFLSVDGCVLDREIRPSGCNWYFCDQLFEHMEKSSERDYTEFDNALQDLADSWTELVTQFHMIFQNVTGHEIGL